MTVTVVLQEKMDDKKWGKKPLFNTCNTRTLSQDSADAVRQAEKATAGEAGVRPGGCQGQEGNERVCLKLTCGN